MCQILRKEDSSNDLTYDRLLQAWNDKFSDGITKAEMIAVCQDLNVPIFHFKSLAEHIRNGNAIPKTGFLVFAEQEVKKELLGHVGFITPAPKLTRMSAYPSTYENFFHYLSPGSDIVQNVVNPLSDVKSYKLFNENLKVNMKQRELEILTKNKREIQYKLRTRHKLIRHWKKTGICVPAPETNILKGEFKDEFDLDNQNDVDRWLGNTKLPIPLPTTYDTALKMARFFKSSFPALYVESGTVTKPVYKENPLVGIRMKNLSLKMQPLVSAFDGLNKQYQDFYDKYSMKRPESNKESKLQSLVDSYKNTALPVTTELPPPIPPPNPYDIKYGSTSMIKVSGYKVNLNTCAVKEKTPKVIASYYDVTNTLVCDKGSQAYKTESPFIRNRLEREVKARIMGNMNKIQKNLLAATWGIDETDVSESSVHHSGHKWCRTQDNMMLAKSLQTLKNLVEADFAQGRKTVIVDVGSKFKSTKTHMSTLFPDMHPDYAIETEENKLVLAKLRKDPKFQQIIPMLNNRILLPTDYLKEEFQFKDVENKIIKEEMNYDNMLSKVPMTDVASTLEKTDVYTYCSISGKRNTPAGKKTEKFLYVDFLRGIPPSKEQLIIRGLYVPTFATFYSRIESPVFLTTDFFDSMSHAQPAFNKINTKFSSNLEKEELENYDAYVGPWLDPDHAFAVGWLANNNTVYVANSLIAKDRKYEEVIDKFTAPGQERPTLVKVNVPIQKNHSCYIHTLFNVMVLCLRFQDGKAIPELKDGCERATRRVWNYMSIWCRWFELFGQDLLVDDCLQQVTLEGVRISVEKTLDKVQAEVVNTLKTTNDLARRYFGTVQSAKYGSGEPLIKFSYPEVA